MEVSSDCRVLTEQVKSSVTPSINDVARLAGVGKGTVSRVLNGNSGVTEKTAARVKHAIKELGYRPNIQARRLARNVSDLICFVLSNRDFLHDFHSMLFKGVERCCSEAGRDVVFALWRYPLSSPTTDIVLPRIIADRGSVDGIVLAGANSIECVRIIEDLGVPYVAFGNNLIGCKSVSEVEAVWYDESTGTREAIEYLVELGHRHIRFVGNLSVQWFARNFQAYSNAMIDSGLSPTAISVDNVSDHIEIAEQAADRIVRSDDPTTAIFAGNDILAFSLVRALKRRGLQVPRDISVVGFDGVPRCVECDPPLTTVNVPKEELGAECASLLFRKIANPMSASSAMVFPTHLVIRDSCSAPRKHT